MAQIQPIIRCELDPTLPVQEVCNVIKAMMPYHPGQDLEILRGVHMAVEQRIAQLEGGEQADGKQVRKPRRQQQDQG